MSEHTPPPRTAEVLLHGLGADTEFRNDVLGDMAEEFAQRVQLDGDRTARRWYYKESLRVAPYLLRDWLRGGGAKDAAQVVVISSTAMIMIELLLMLTLNGTAMGLGVPRHTYLRILAALPGSFWIPAGMLAWTAVDGFCAGYIAASLGKRAPIPNALALAATWTGVVGTLNFLLKGPPIPIPLAFRVLNLAALGGGMIAGGVLRVIRLGRLVPRPSVE